MVTDASVIHHFLELCHLRQTRKKWPISQSSFHPWRPRENITHIAFIWEWNPHPTWNNQNPLLINHLIHTILTCELANVLPARFDLLASACFEQTAHQHHRHVEPPLSRLNEKCRQVTIQLLSGRRVVIKHSATAWNFDPAGWMSAMCAQLSWCETTH